MSAPTLPTFTWDTPRTASITVEAVTMTRQHFQHIADGIKSAPVDDETRSRLADHFATHLSGTNDNFNRDRFVKACH